MTGLIHRAEGAAHQSISVSHLDSHSSLLPKVFGQMIPLNEIYSAYHILNGKPPPSTPDPLCPVHLFPPGSRILEGEEFTPSEHRNGCITWYFFNSYGNCRPGVHTCLLLGKMEGQLQEKIRKF